MKPSLDVVFATYSVLPQGDPDDLLALSLLESQGLNVAVVDWRTVAASQLDSRLVVLRSTWDYHHYYQQFLDWVDVLASRTRVENDVSLIHWNANKKYLLQLEQCQVPIVPTLYVAQSAASRMDASSLSALCSMPKVFGAAEIIIKPAVGLSTFGVKRFNLSQSDAADICGHMASLAVSSDVMIQPYLEAVENYGERSLVFIDNRFSHAVRKTAFQAMAVAGGAGETSVTATDGEIAFGENVLAQLKTLGLTSPLYARVDVVHDADDKMKLLELELIEPSLFLGMGEGAPARFAEAIAAALD